MKASETQIAGQHYKDFPIQPAEFCQRNRLNWCEANVVKYVCRHTNKKGAEDLLKAKHYIDLLLEWEYGVGEVSEPLVKDTTAASLCHTCQRNAPFKCHGEYLMTKDGGCEGYLRDLPDMGCTNTDCSGYSPSYLRNCGIHLPGAMRSCERYTTAKQDTPTAAERPAPHTGGLVARPPVPKTGIPVNCKDCATTSACVGKGVNLTLDQGCGHYVPKEAAK